MIGLVPADIVKRTLSGTGGTGANVYQISYLFNEDGTLIVTKDSKEYFGNWEFDKSEKFMPYTIEWNEDSNKQGYLAAIMQEGEVIKLLGHWFITDMYKTIFETLKKE